MSIPKKPREIMVNLMYIVLTAMLALNVSAEILDAFMDLDGSIHESNLLAKKSNNMLLKEMQHQAEAYPQFVEYAEKAEKVRELCAEFDLHIDQLKEIVIVESGGRDESGFVKNIRNKDVTTRLFVNESRGDLLRDKIGQLRDSLVQIIDESERMELALRIPLKVKEIPENSDKKTWAEYNFYQMPVAAVLPILSKFQNDAKLSETVLMNHFANKISVKPVYDEYEAIISADKSYLTLGEQINTEVFLGAYSSTTDNIFIKINGQNVPVRNGKAVYSATPESIGKKELETVITIRNPLTEEVKSYRKKFVYEVGERSVTLSPDKMNVFYVGVDNPISISAAGVPSASLKIDAGGLPLTKKSNHQYTVKPTKPGRATIRISGEGLDVQKFDFRIRRIPTPSAKVGEKSGGLISKGELQIYDRINPVLENFDFEAQCRITSFELTREKKNGDVFSTTNTGGTFDSKTKRFISEAKRGDKYFFEKIKAKCPGDLASRTLNNIVFRIK